MGELIGWLLVGAFVFAILKAIWPFIVVGVVIYIAVKIAKHVVDRHNTALAAERAVRKAVRSRADRQHVQVLRGDAAGVYGDYPVPDLGEYNPTLWVCNQPLRKCG